MDCIVHEVTQSRTWLSDFHFTGTEGFPASSAGKECACSVGDLSSIPGLGRSPGKRNGNLLQYSCLENSLDRGAWWATCSSKGSRTVRHDWVTNSFTFQVFKSTTYVFEFLKLYAWFHTYKPSSCPCALFYLKFFKKGGQSVTIAKYVLRVRNRREQEGK